jgi:AAA domain, putative AbiEii toxin, Type IV TA system
MLYRLEIENFYSIRDPAEIDLRIADNVPDFPGRFDRLFPGSSERAPRVVSFFGPNASGKSNVLKSLAFLAWFGRESFQLQPQASLPYERFNDTEAQLRPTRLAVEFSGPMDLTATTIDASTSYGTWRYELEMAARNGRNCVSHEALRQKPDGKGKWTRVFERDADGEVQAGRTFGLAGYSMVTDKVRDNASLISTLAQFDHKPSLRLRDAAATINSNILVDRTETPDLDLIRYYATNAEIVAALNREIGRIDLGIRQMRIVQTPTGPLPQFDHDGLQQPMPWILESHGTRSFVRYFPMLHVALARGGVAMVDEIDVSIHPLVLPEILRWFHDPVRNPRGAQLWMTCHAASLLEELAKEEVFFCEKDSRGRTSIYGLQDIRNVRRTDNRYRKYLSGVYGAVPQIG